MKRRLPGSSMDTATNLTSAHHRKVRAAGLGRRGSTRLIWPPFLLLLLLVVGGLMTSACAGPTPSPSPTALPNTTILSDNFSPPNSAWARFDTDASAVYALDGELYLEDRGQGTAVYSPLVGYQYADTTISVSVRQVQGTVNNWMGTLCRMQDENNYYLLAISADGYYLILKVVNGESTPLVGPAFSSAIQTGKAENQLKMSCDGTDLALQVNGEELAKVTDDTFQEAGDIGLFADAVPTGDLVTVAFDNFVLTSP